MKNSKGITLIALIITIVILLILVSVTLNLTVGNNGIVETTKWAGYVTEYEAVNERIQLYSTDRILNKYAKENRIASIDDIVITTEQERKGMYPVSNKIGINEVSVSLRQTIKQMEGIKTKELTDEILVNLYKVDLGKINVTANKQYVINIISGKLYSIESEEYKGKKYHTPREGTGIANDYVEIVPNIDEAGKYEIVIDAGQIVEWESIQVNYGRYIENALSMKVYTSEDEDIWKEEGIELGNRLSKEELYNIVAENKTQYLKIEIEVKEVNGKSPEIEYILVNFYKYKALEITPQVQASGVDKIGNRYVVPTVTNGETRNK